MDRARAALLALVAALLALGVAFVLPFLEYFLLAVLLAYVLMPVQRRLEARVGVRPAAITIAFAAAVTIVVPALWVVRTTYFQGLDLLRRIRAGEVTFAGVEQWLAEVGGVQVDISELLQSALRDFGPDAVGSVVSIVGTLAHVTIGLGLTLFLLYYFLKDRRGFVAWLRRRLPLSRDVQDELYAEVDNIMAAVLAGHVLVAIIQGLIAGVGLAVAGVPNAAFWTVVMIVLALLPILGSFLVWGPAVVWLVAVGRPGAAAGLCGYGTFGRGISDDYLRPIIVDRYAELNPSVIIIGVLGGIYVIGVMGIFFGPIVLGSLRAALDVYDREVAATA